MDHSLSFEAVIAPADFDPTPGETGSLAGQVVRPPRGAGVLRGSGKEWAVDRPVRRSLLELGLAHGPDAAEWEMGMRRADAMQRAAERLRGLAGPTARNDAGVAIDANRDGADAPNPKAGNGPLTQQALLAMASEVQTLHKRRQALGEELAELERRQAELEAKILRYFNRRGGAGLPAAPEPPAPPPGSGLPMHAWNGREQGV